MFGNRKLPYRNLHGRCSTEVSHAAHQTAAGNSRVSEQLPRGTAMRRASRKSPNSSTITRWRRSRAPEQSGAQGLHQAQLQRESGDRDSPVGGESAGGRVAALGLVAAGMPIEAMMANETIAVAERLRPALGGHYVLRVRGNSMIDEQIRDGDFVVVKSGGVSTTARWSSPCSAAPRRRSRNLSRTRRADPAAAGQ